ncbi:MAG: thiamine phosphate synthase [Vicinamibacteraceae bacterium]|nr:thiamine phosphate synthase [Vicinamibacteraceae bacterium]
MPLPRPVWCFVTDRRRLFGTHPAGPERALVALCARLARAGLTLIQVREPDLEARTLAALVRAVLDAVAGTATRVVVNDRADVALATGAHGVHLKGRSMRAHDLRPHVPAGWLVGQSVHGFDELALSDPTSSVDYYIAGTVCPSASKPGATTCLGWDGLAGIARRTTRPVLGIGGLSAADAPRIAASGAAGLAAIGLFGALDTDRRAADAMTVLTAGFAAGGTTE